MFATKFPTTAAAAICCLLVAGAANAKTVGVNTFFGQDLGGGETARVISTPNADAARSAFKQATGKGRMESFESIPHDTWAATQGTDGKWTLGRPLDFAGNYGGSSKAVGGSIGAATGTFWNQPTGTNGFGRYPTDGDVFFQTGASELVIELDRHTNGFGFDLVDAGDFDAQLEVDLYDGDALIHALTIAHAIGSSGGDAAFWGVVDDLNPFNKVVIRSLGGANDVYGIDALLVETPLPGALPLLAAGMASLAWARRRKTLKAGA